MTKGHFMSADLSIYVHIPFCKRKCLYCDFLSFSAGKELTDSYFGALEREISFSSQQFSNCHVKSVFLGGGTPSFPDSFHICNVLDQIKESFDLLPDAEISIEVNPGTVTLDKLRDYRKAGINRLSIGAQSLNDEELKRLGRIHTADVFLRTFADARTAGFDNINVDIMSALPGQKLSSYLETLRGVCELCPEHISAYSLIVEEGTPFYDMDLDLPDEDEDRLMYHETKRILSEHGYHRYEISNYARNSTERPDKYECFHNTVYWRRGNYLGVGLGASSLVDNVRFSNITDISEYVKRVSDGSFTPADIRENVQKLTKEDMMEEFMFLGLRMVEGVNISEFNRIFSEDFEKVYGEVASKYEKMGLLECYTKEAPEDKWLRLTSKGLDVSNTVMADFLL